MTAFTVLGVLWFWWFCWELGYHIGMFFDAKERIDLLIGKTFTSELEALIAFLPKEQAR